MGQAVAGSLTSKEKLPDLVTELSKPTAEGFSRMASEFKVTPCYYGNNIQRKINTLCCKRIMHTDPFFSVSGTVSLILQTLPYSPLCSNLVPTEILQQV